MATPYQVTDRTLTLVINGRPEVLLNGSTQYDLALGLLADTTLSEEDRDAALVRLTRPTLLLSDLDDDRVEVSGRRVLFDGESLPSGLTRKLLEVARMGLPLAPWKRFVIRLQANPSSGAKADLNEFLEAGDFAITDDGCFLAYKRVSETYRDLHSGTFDNSVGSVCSMPRQHVDADRAALCSTGLHFCSHEYLSKFYGGAGRIVIVKVDPADVVAIPLDYNRTKGRTWRYEVVGEVELSTEQEALEWGVYDSRFTKPVDVEDDDWDDPVDWELDDDEIDELDESVEDDEDYDVAIAFVNPEKRRRGKFSEWFRRNF